jgi:hypothetical protein
MQYSDTCTCAPVHTYTHIHARYFFSTQSLFASCVAYWASPAVVTGKGAQLLNINSGRQKGGREEEDMVYQRKWGHRERVCVGEREWVRESG